MPRRWWQILPWELKFDVASATLRGMVAAESARNLTVTFAYDDDIFRVALETAVAADSELWASASVMPTGVGATAAIDSGPATSHGKLLQLRALDFSPVPFPNNRSLRTMLRVCLLARSRLLCPRPRARAQANVPIVGLLPATSRTEVVVRAAVAASAAREGPNPAMLRPAQPRRRVRRAMVGCPLSPLR